jgi:Cytidylate kinase-like family
VPASVICLSHADGAGGREIGELLAQRLGFRYVDDGIVVAAAGAGQLYPEAVAVAESPTASAASSRRTTTSWSTPSG